MQQLDTVEFNGRKYPAWQASGNAARFIMPFAKEVCTMNGFDIGCHSKKWALPGAVPIDIVFNNGFDAYNLPKCFAKGEVNYIFSSHCLEHLPNWVTALDYWIDTISPGGVLFLYLPHYDQEYWRPWNNHKHIHALHPQVLRDYFENKNRVNDLYITGADLNHSFAVLVSLR